MISVGMKIDTNGVQDRNSPRLNVQTDNQIQEPVSARIPIQNWRLSCNANSDGAAEISRAGPQIQPKQHRKEFAQKSRTKLQIFPHIRMPPNSLQILAKDFKGHIQVQIDLVWLIEL